MRPNEVTIGIKPPISNVSYLYHIYFTKNNFNMEKFPVLLVICYMLISLYWNMINISERNALLILLRHWHKYSTSISIKCLVLGLQQAGTARQYNSHERKKLKMST